MFAGLLVEAVDEQWRERESARARARARERERERAREKRESERARDHGSSPGANLCHPSQREEAAFMRVSAIRLWRTWA